MASSSSWLNQIDSQANSQNDDSEAQIDWMAPLSSPVQFVAQTPFVVPEADPVADPIAEPAIEIVGPDSPFFVGPIFQERVEPAPDPLAKAFELGQAAGRLIANSESLVEERAERSLKLHFRAFDQAAIDSLAQELCETVIDLCGAALSDFEATPESLLERCARAAKRLGSSANECSLHLNPSDIDLLSAEALDAWTIVPDPSLERGGLRFEGADGSISDTPEDWRRAIAMAIRG